MIDEEIGKYKKKSTAKGQARSKHKHEYETVLLTRISEYVDFDTGNTKSREHVSPTKVCTICGRIDYRDEDPSYYEICYLRETPYKVYCKELSPKALKLPKYTAGFFDKFASHAEEVNDEL